MNIMLLGSTGSGKSASGNTILNRATNPFEEDFSPDSVTRFCRSAQTEVDEQTITVIDTVGLCDADVKMILKCSDAQTHIEQMIQLHNIDVFLLVIKLGETFRNNDSKVVRWIKENLGEKAFKHTMVLFTHGDQLHGSVERYLNKSKGLRSVVDQCSGGFHVFNNKKEDKFQVPELLKEIKTLRMRNGRSRYTQWDYKEARECRIHTICLIGVVLGVLGGAVLGGLLALAGLAGAAMAVNTGTVALTAGEAALKGATMGAVLAGAAALLVEQFVKKYTQ